MKNLFSLSVILFPLAAYSHESSMPHDHISLGVVMAVALIGLSAVFYKRFK